LTDAPRPDGRGVYTDVQGTLDSTRGEGATKTGMAEGDPGDAADSVLGEDILARTGSVSVYFK
jgi:hypothetical protein